MIKQETKEKVMAFFLGVVGGAVMGVILQKIKNPIYLVTAVFLLGLFIGFVICAILLVSSGLK